MHAAVEIVEKDMYRFRAFEKAWKHRTGVFAEVSCPSIVCVHCIHFLLALLQLAIAHLTPRKTSARHGHQAHIVSTVQDASFNLQYHEHTDCTPASCMPV